MYQKHTYKSVKQYLRKHRLASIIAGHLIFLTVCAITLSVTTFGPYLSDTFAKAACSTKDATYSVRSGDTLGTIAARYKTTWQKLASYNHLANPNVIYINQKVCVPGKGKSGSPSYAPIASTGASIGKGNPFPYGQCTWWGSERYYQMTGRWVPWTINANGGQWNERAYEFGWKVSSSPKVSAIVVLEGNVQGASYWGHVAVVERVLSNGKVIASNLNWGPYYAQVSNVEFTPGPGVSFVSYN